MSDSTQNQEDKDLDPMGAGRIFWEKTEDGTLYLSTMPKGKPPGDNWIEFDKNKKVDMVKQIRGQLEGGETWKDTASSGLTDAAGEEPSKQQKSTIVSDDNIAQSPTIVSSTTDDVDGTTTALSNTDGAVTGAVLNPLGSTQPPPVAQYINSNTITGINQPPPPPPPPRPRPRPRPPTEQSNEERIGGSKKLKTNNKKHTRKNKK